jgi:tight adherence protein B
MDTYYILIFLFFGIFAVSWIAISASQKGFSKYERKFTEETDDKLESLFLFMDSKKIFFLNIALLIVVPLLLYFVYNNWFYVIVAVVGLAAMPKITLILMEKRRKDAINNALPDTLAQIAGAMRAGATFQTALETMTQETRGPIAQEFTLLLKEQRLGKTLDESLDNLAERIQTEEMDLVVTATQISKNVGGNLAEIFLRLSETLRKKMEMEGKIKALTAQGKLQGWVVAMLPFGIIGALFFVEPEGIAPIFSSLLGWIFLGIILILEVLGGLMIRKIVTIDI